MITRHSPISISNQASLTTIQHAQAEPPFLQSLKNCRELNQLTYTLAHFAQCLRQTLQSPKNLQLFASNREKALFENALINSAAVEKAGSEIIQQVAALLNRPQQGGPSLTPHEEGRSDDLMKQWFARATDAYNTLHQHTEALIQGLGTRSDSSVAQLADELSANVQAEAAQGACTLLGGEAPGTFRARLSEVLQGPNTQARDPLKDFVLPERARAQVGRTPLQQLAEAFVALSQPVTAPASPPLPRANLSQLAVLDQPNVKGDDAVLNVSARTPRAISSGAAPVQPNPLLAEIEPLRVKQFEESQLAMIDLNEHMPKPARTAELALKNWFRSRFSELSERLSPDMLEVRTWRDEVIEPYQQETGGPKTRRVGIKDVPLTVLYHQALAGNKVPGFELRNTEIVHNDGQIKTPVPQLSGDEALAAVQLMLKDTTPSSFAQNVTDDLNEFWEKTSSFSQGLPVKEWAALEFGAQLRAEADLRAHDGTLSPELHKVLTDKLLSVPAGVDRANMFEEGARPGVFALNDSWADDAASKQHILGTLVFTQHDDLNNPGRLALWQPGKALVEFDSLAALKQKLSDQGDILVTAELEPVNENFLDRRVSDIRKLQEAAARGRLAQIPKLGVGEWLDTRGNTTTDVGLFVDLKPASAERVYLKTQNFINEWLHKNPLTTDSDRLAWLAAQRASLAAVLDTLDKQGSLPPEADSLASPEAIKAWTRKELVRVVAEKYGKTINPDEIYLSIDQTVVEYHEPDGSSIYSTGYASAGAKKLTQDRRSLTEWAMSNMTSEQMNAKYHHIEGPLNLSEIGGAIATVNVGSRYAEWMGLTAREKQPEWMVLKEKQIRSEALAAQVSGDLGGDREQTELKMILAALDSPSPEGRRKVNGHEVVVRQLQRGDSVFKDVFVVGARQIGARPWVTVYTPGAPDGKTFRNVEILQGMRSKDVLIKALTATPEMTRWLTSLLPLKNQIALTAGLERTDENTTVPERFNKFTGNALGSTASRTRPEFIISEAPEVKENLLKTLHETQLKLGLKNADELTVSNAERDSTAAQEGRLKGLALILGAISMGAGRKVGSLLSRTVPLLMTGGAAVTAIKDQGGSPAQWTKDFILGLKDVLSEGFEDFIVGRVNSSPKGRARTTLSSMPSMPDPIVGEFKVKRVDEKKLTRLDNGVYRDNEGLQDYIKFGSTYVKSDIQGGKRVIYSPNNRTYSRTIEFKDGKWTILPHQGVIGGSIPEMSINAAEPKYITIKQKVDNFYATPKFRSPPYIAPLPAGITPSGLIDSIYSKSKGIVLGESHNQIASHAFLSDHMADLKRNGVNTIYMEGYFGEVDKKLTKGATVIHKELRNEDLHRGGFGWPYRVADVHDKAKAHGIKIIGIDDKAYTVADSPKLDTSLHRREIVEYRLKMMNYLGAGAIQAFQKQNPGKWIALVGQGHMKTSHYIAGLAEFLGVPGIEIHNSKPGLATRITQPSPPDTQAGIGPGDYRIDLNIDSLPKAADLP